MIESARNAKKRHCEENASQEPTPKNAIDSTIRELSKRMTELKVNNPETLSAQLLYLETAENGSVRDLQRIEEIYPQNQLALFIGWSLARAAQNGKTQAVNHLLNFKNFLFKRQYHDAQQLAKDNGHTELAEVISQRMEERFTRKA